MKEKVKLPRLKPSRKTKKRYHYKLKSKTLNRRRAINEGIRSETKRNLRKSAIAKKGRLNILRIYRRKRKRSECRKITRDMKYIDKKYKLGKTRDICF